MDIGSFWSLFGPFAWVFNGFHLVSGAEEVSQEKDLEHKKASKLEKEQLIVGKKSDLQDAEKELLGFQNDLFGAILRDERGVFSGFSHGFGAIVSYVGL